MNNNIKRFKKLVFIILIVLQSCAKEKEIYYLPTQVSENSFNAVIEIPAGTNKKYEYDKESKSFIIDKKDGKERIIDFLPYPGNYGFIPSTYSDPKTGGDGDALDVLVLSEYVPTGSVLEIKPIAILKLIDNGEIDYKIIAIPSNVKQQIINVNNYNDLANRFPEVKTIIELWFLNYNKTDTATIEGWGDDKMALIEINKSKS
ncbi:inorganic diphosphatase [Flaviramulus aquimarinus]|uniref:inorganic diphosphatase n=1 Tax=Flaviramulus aquimarinus TaxID=1170456 RepID=UPI0031EDD360